MKKRLLLIMSVLYQWSYAQTLPLPPEKETNAWTATKKILEREKKQVWPGQYSADTLPYQKESVIRVFSQKTLRTSYDSLRDHHLIKPIEVPAKQAVSRQVLLQSINEEFALSGSSNPINDTPRQVQKALTAISSTEQALTEEASETLASLSALQLPDAEQPSLELLRGNFLKNEYLKRLDSVRKESLQTAGLRLQEHSLNEGNKVALFSPKPSFWSNAFIETVLGFSPLGEQAKTVQFSPALGYHIHPNLSLGIGPALQATYQDRKRTLTSLGIRTFAKAEFYQRRAYLQVEDAFQLHHYQTEELSSTSPHRVLVGGGYLLRLSSSLSLNVALLYQVNENKLTTTELSPWMLRLGISAIKFH